MAKAPESRREILCRFLMGPAALLALGAVAETAEQPTEGVTAAAIARAWPHAVRYYHLSGLEGSARVGEVSREISRELDAIERALEPVMAQFHALAAEVDRCLEAYAGHPDYEEHADDIRRNLGFTVHDELWDGLLRGL